MTFFWSALSPRCATCVLALATLQKHGDHVIAIQHVNACNDLRQWKSEVNDFCEPPLCEMIFQTPHGVGVSEDLFVVVMAGNVPVSDPAPFVLLPFFLRAHTSSLPTPFPDHIVGVRGFSHSSAGSLWW